jgi:soluble lytic murein transglycosylase-like protein
MARLLALVLALEVLAVPAAGRAGELYAFVDGDGVIHVTNVPQDSRYRRLKVRLPDYDGVHRITINGRRSPPRHLRRSSVAYDEHIRAAAQKYGLAPPLLKAVMAAESNFDPAAVSDKGATGLMQLMPATAREMSVVDPRDPAQNIDGGARYLKALQERYDGDLEKVLAAYNAGPEAVRRSGGAIPDIAETQAYVRKVLGLYQGYMKAP